MLEKVREAILAHKKDDIESLVERALEQGLEPNRIMEEGLIAPMDIIGEKFASGEIFVPEMMVSALIMKMGLEKVKPHLMGGQLESKGRVLIGTVKGDLHDIGKNIVAMMMEASGFEVIDLGVDLSAEDIAEKVKELKPGVLGLSALLTTTMGQIQNVLTVLTEMGLRDQVKVIVGGAPLNNEFAEKVGADGYGDNATEAVALCKKFMA
jgi:5-methyltetrahydrofolate--homocysteine methyltransferase